jgi:LPS export ABC transporter protein LptC
MKSHWFSIVAFMAALLLGYAVINPGQDDVTSIPAPVLGGYYVRDAVIIETSDDGAPRMRITAAHVQQDPRDNAVQLDTVHADYLAPADDDQAATHWVITAAQGHMPPKSDVVTLSGNVVAKTVDAVQSVAFATPSLNIDTQQQLANTAAPVTIDVSGHRITGQGLSADLQREQLQLKGQGQLRLSADQPLAEIATSDDTKISLPGIFDHEGLELREGGIRLTKVRSKTEPFVQADEAVASSTDLDNNRFTLRGNVRLDLPQQGNLQADTAIVTVRDSRIVHAVASGKSASPNGEPVRFEHRRQTKEPSGEVKVDTARGRATNIDYDVLTNLLVFTGDVWFSTGRFEWRGEEWQYNLTDGSGKTTRRSTTTVLPDQEASDSPSTP